MVVRRCPECLRTWSSSPAQHTAGSRDLWRQCDNVWRSRNCLTHSAPLSFVRTRPRERESRDLVHRPGPLFLTDSNLWWWCRRLFLQYTARCTWLPWEGEGMGRLHGRCGGKNVCSRVTIQVNWQLLELQSMPLIATLTSVGGHSLFIIKWLTEWCSRNAAVLGFRVVLN